MNSPASKFEAIGSRVQDLFVAQARQSPERIAVSLGSESLTYGSLASRASSIAALLHEQGIRPGDLVGVFLDRSFELIASLLGILEAGAAYVPLDTNYPGHRLTFMVGDTSMKVILSSGALAARVPRVGTSVQVVDLIEYEPRVVNVASAFLEESKCFSDKQAYVMYTSGSTGQPKGVAIPHRGIVRLVQDPDFVQISPEDVFLQASPVSFDASTFEIWGALTNGARLALLPPGQPSLEAIGKTIQKERVSVLWLTAGLFNLMVDERLEDLRPVKQLLVGGDVLSVRHVRCALEGLPNTQLINGYGPTENTTFTCCYAIPKNLPANESVPIGTPIRGTSVHVVDENLCEVVDGGEGELLTGGLGLALGYWNRPALTEERFVTLAGFNDPPSRFYRTGDRVRRRHDGVLEFLGRKDSQVKVRGFRIELEEIESAIREHPNVRDCAVAIWSDGSGNKSLAAWVVPVNNRQITPDDLKEHSTSHLPPHMVPGFWTVLDELPLNANGKVDRPQLLLQFQHSPIPHGEGPKNELERKLVRVWQELLPGRPVGVLQSYFDLGANSLTVAQAHERLRRQHGLDLELTDLFRFTTVRSLADFLASDEQARSGSMPACDSRPALRRAALQRFKKL